MMPAIDFTAIVERAAFLEHCCHVPRADSDRLALGENYDRLERRPPVGILGELITEDRQRRDPKLAPALKAMRLDQVRISWGFAHIIRDGLTHRLAAPDEMGVAAFVVPATQGGQLVDLVAEEIGTGAISTRLDVATVIGADYIEQARTAGMPVYLYATVRQWLRGGGIGMVIVDWRRAAAELDGVASILCSPRIADRLRRATAGNFPRPIIATPRRAAAHAA